MRIKLALHPDFTCDAVDDIHVQISHNLDGQIDLLFSLHGRIDHIAIPEKAEPKRSDGLWQTTCCEAFIRPKQQSGYCEYNFAPSTRWAAYQFEAYRVGMKSLDTPPPAIEIGHTTSLLTLAARLAPTLPTAQPWQIGLSAVIEECNGNKSYWALAHPPGKADFHHDACFALTL